MNIIRQEKDGIEFFTIEATGESGLSQTGLALLCGIAKQSLNELLNTLSGKSPSKWLDVWVDKDYLLIETLKQGGNVKLLKASFCAAVIQHYCYSKNAKTAARSLNSLNLLLTKGFITTQDLIILDAQIDNRPTKKGYEATLRDKLAKNLQGLTEVGCIAGRIDVLTPTELIEVKKIKHWKAAIGQVLVYSAYYPQHKKRIHLYGNAHIGLVKIIQTHCDRLNIQVTFENVVEAV